MIQKAIVPVAGMGNKLRPHTHTQPKPLMPVAGKPILGHIIDSLVEAGITQHIFVLGYLGEKIREYVENEYGDSIQAEFVVQEPRLGLAQAIGLCSEKLEGINEIVIVLGDTIFGDEIMRIVQHSAPNILGVQEVDDPRKFGVCVVDEQGKVLSAMEKPQIPVSNQAMVGLYKIKQVKLLLECIKAIMQGKPATNGLYSLTEAFQCMIERGVAFHTLKIDNWYDCGNKDTLLKTNRILLERKPASPKFDFPRSVIIPPVDIAPGCRIENSIIGPYVAIAENSTILNSIVRDSIVGAYSHLDFMVMNQSVLGNDTTLKGKAHSINIGDNTEINFDE